MTRDRRRVISICALFFVSALIAFALVNRWVFTELGFLSYGRIWHLYISYSDFGFVRRAFLGTLLSETGLNTIFRNEYYFAHAAQLVAITILSAIIAYYCISRKIFNGLFVASIALSPVFIIHSGYNTGSLDVFVLLLASINILFTRGAIMFSAIIAIGILTHEVFIFTIPAQIYCLLERNASRDWLERARFLFAPIASGVLVAIAVIAFGKVDMSKEAVSQIMQQKLPTVVESGVDDRFWSGYFEISTTAEQNVAVTKRYAFSELQKSFVYFIIPASYLLFLIIRLRSYSTSTYEFLILALASIAPLLIVLVATDFYRWIAMSANLAILVTLAKAERKEIAQPRLNLVLLAFFIFSPFGTAQIDRPLPAHQFVFDRLFQ